MWSKRSHLIHPLTVLTSNKANFKWTDVEQKTFDEVKHIVTHNTLFAYPDFNKSSSIHTYYSGYQIGEFISHDGKPIALYIRKLTGPQTHYKVTEN